jgi:hypothetical protein
MASQHRKHRGYKTQRLVADYFVEQGWPHAYSVGAGASGTDIARLPFDVEVKARTGFNPKAALAQIKARSVGLGFAVLRLNGQGEDVRDYCAVIRFEDLVNLLKKAGYSNLETMGLSRFAAINVVAIKSLDWCVKRAVLSISMLRL